MSSTNTKNRDGGVTGQLGGDARRGGGLTVGPVTSTELPLKPGVQPGQGGRQNPEQVCSLLHSSRGLQHAVGDAGTGISKSFDNFISSNSVTTQHAVGDAGRSFDSREDDDSIINDAIDISTLDLTCREDSYVSFADITFDNINTNHNYSDVFVDSINDNDLVKVQDEDNTGDSDMKVDGKNEGGSGRTQVTKGKRSFPESNKERRLKKNQRKAEKVAYKIPEDPFLQMVDKEFMKRKTYSDCVKDKKSIILEIRNEDIELPLEQEDFRKINSFLLFKYYECKQQSIDELDATDEDDETSEDDDEANENKYFYGVVGGISNGACWLACDNQTTADFVKHHVPLISSNTYRYVVFDSENKPFRYMRAKVPSEMWANRKTVEGMFKACNRILTKKSRNDKGKRKAPHFKICYGCESYEQDLDEDNPNYFWIQFEVDEKLLNKLADMKGRLRLGANSIMLLGGGMVAKAKEVIANQLKVSINTINDGSG